jgi:protein-S-isoprenylcysteine O-methyltransferase Ste14
MFPILSVPIGTTTGWVPYVPALSLIALFLGSTWLTEKISYGKYGEVYGAYQARVGMLLPVPWGWWVRVRKGREEERRLNRLVWGVKG